MTAYRDDLEAAQLRASDLERELREVRARNAQLEELRARNERPLPAPAASRQLVTQTLDGRRRKLTAIWIASLVGAGYLSAPWAVVLVSIAFVVMMITPFTRTIPESQ